MLEIMLLLTFGKLHVSKDQILRGLLDTLEVFLCHSFTEVS